MKSKKTTVGLFLVALFSSIVPQISSAQPADHNSGDSSAPAVKTIPAFESGHADTEGTDSNVEGGIDSNGDTPKEGTASQDASPPEVASSSEVNERVEAASVDTSADLAPTPLPAPLPGSLPYEFTPVQLEDLARAGCKFDENDIAGMKNAAARGFSAYQAVSAYEQLKRIGGDPRALDKMATVEFVGLTTSDFRRIEIEKLDLTDYYNNVKFRAKGAFLVGAVFTIAGAGLTAGGTALLLYALRSMDCTGASAESCLNVSYVGIVLDVFGVLFVGTGITGFVVGAKTKKRRAPEGLLDTGTVEEMGRHAGASSRLSAGTAAHRSGPRVAVVPYFFGKQGGISTAVTF
jgi:hypothetical protein